MKRVLFLIIGTILTTSVFAQIVRQNEQFKTVSVINNKVIFIKEVAVNKTDKEKNYSILKEWGRENYGKDPFISSIRYDNRKKEILANSRVELILPVNSSGLREKMVMRFRVNGFLSEDKCVIEIEDISFLSGNSGNKNLPRVIRAEEFITNEKLAIEDDLAELRLNTKRSVLYFLNTLGKDFEKQFGH